MKNWSPLHHQMWRHLRDSNLHQDRKRPFLVCVSGGADSMALLSIVKDLPLSISVFHAHHGLHENAEFRNQARDFVKSFCLQHKILFVDVQSPNPLTSESEMREFRRQHFQDWLKQNPQGVIMTAHHSDDLLETRVLRLIRGTGPEGLKSMSIWKPPFFRPFLETSAKELRKYLNDHQQDWVEDPTNAKSRYLRNWVRNKWLPALEKRKPGSVKRLAVSLENLASQAPNKVWNKSITRSEFASLSQRDQIEALAQLLRSQGQFEFTQGQLKEVQKRLDNPKRRLTFEVAGALWSVNAQRITVEVMGESQK